MPVRGRALSRPPVARCGAPSLDCAHGEHLDPDAAPGRRAAVRAGQRLPDPPRAGLLAGRRVGPHQPRLDLLRARDPRPRRAPGPAPARRGQPHGHASTRPPRRGAPSSSGSSREAVRTHDRGSARGFTTALSLQPLVDRAVFLGLLEERLVAVDALLAEGEALAAAPADVLPPHLPPLIGLWQAQARTERAWLVDMIAGLEAGAGCLRRRARPAGRRRPTTRAGPCRPTASATARPSASPTDRAAPSPSGGCGQVAALGAASFSTHRGADRAADGTRARALGDLHAASRRA